MSKLHKATQALLHNLHTQANYRTLTDYQHSGAYITHNHAQMLNFTSNDYLSLASASYAIAHPYIHRTHTHHTTYHNSHTPLESNGESALDSSLDSRATYLAERFWEFVSAQAFTSDNLCFGATSSRSLSGGFLVWEAFEAYLKQLYAKSALLFNSGYHLNISCISALGRLESMLILIDEFAHASMFDGILHAKGFHHALRWKRFRHNDMAHLGELVESSHKHYRHILIITEGVFSMEGDVCDLAGICAIKRQYDNVLIYLDEAHSIGVMGEKGLGLARSSNLSDEVDFLISTFGKALGSVGACMLCSESSRAFFINTARALIYSTALPPINVAFSYFAFSMLGELECEREHIRALSHKLKALLLDSNHRTKELESNKAESMSVEQARDVRGDLHIISLILGDNKRALTYQAALESYGIFARAIKSPTIPESSARVRFCLHAGIPNLAPLESALRNIAL